MVRVYVFEDHKRAHIAISNYLDDQNKFVLRKAEEEFREGKIVSSTGAGLKYLEPIELCHDNAGYFFDGRIISNNSRSYGTLDSLVIGLKVAIPTVYPGTGIDVVPMYYTIKNHNYSLLAPDSILTCGFNPTFAKLASCRGLRWLERKRFSMAHSSLFCF